MEDTGVNMTTILKWILNEIGWHGVAGLIWLRMELVAGSCECNNEPGGSLMHSVSRLAEKLPVFEGVCYMELVGWLVSFNKKL
jgi:hypothetical protein